MHLQALLPTFTTFLLLQPCLAQPKHCSLLGPDIPPPRKPSNSTAIQTALLSIQSAISSAINTENTTYGLLDTTSTSFSISIFSQHEPDSLFTYHYNAPSLANSSDGVKEIDGDSLYRIGSISKLLTVYTFLITVGDTSFNEPITKFIPELAQYTAQNPASNNEIDITDWSSITIGSLTSHLGGIPLSTAGDARADPAVAVYLPPGVQLPNIISPIPANISDDACPNVVVSPCTRAAFFKSITLAHPGLTPFHGPSYSNVAFSLLAFALESMTGKNFSTLFDENFIASLRLNDTYYSKPPLSQGVIPHNDTIALFSQDLIFIDPAGSYYSSSNDLRLIGQAILNSTLLSPAQTRRWMKPSTFTANDDMLVGSPWEIFKAPPSSSSNSKSSWMYTKAGHIGLYYSNFVLLPDWDFGFSVLAAGDDAVPVNTVISDIIAAIAVPAFEQAAKEEAASTYSGIYTSSVYYPNETLKIGVDGFPGLAVTEWVLNGTDMVKGFADVGMELRLNPSGLRSGNGDGDKEGWRMVIQLQEQVEGAFVLNCMDWFTVDAAVYGGVGLDEFVVGLSGQGRATSVDARGFRGVYERV